MTKRGKANNRINIVSFHPHIWFSIQSNLFRSDADPKTALKYAKGSFWDERFLLPGSFARRRHQQEEINKYR